MLMRYVADSAPNCTASLPVERDTITMLEKQVISFQCSLEYRGKVSPEMEWRKNNNIKIIQSAKNHIQNNRVTSSLDLTASSNDFGSIYTCTTLFKETPNASRVNFPGYHLIWEAPQLNVLCMWQMCLNIYITLVFWQSLFSHQKLNVCPQIPNKILETALHTFYFNMPRWYSDKYIESMVNVLMWFHFLSKFLPEKQQLNRIEANWRMVNI